MHKFQGEFYKYRCLFCNGMGMVAIVDPKNSQEMPKSKLCPMCNGKGFLNVKKSDYEHGE